METDNGILASLYYLKPHSRWEAEKPFTLFVDVSKINGASNTNIEKELIGDIKVRDVRNSIHDLSLDENGFELLDLGGNFSAAAFEDARWMEETYYPFVCNLVKEKLGAKDIRVYEHKLRYRHPGFGDPRFRGHAEYDPPIPQVHADMTPAYGPQVFAEKWPEALDSERLQILNIWRPLVDEVLEWPLALCNYPSVDAGKDLVATDQIKRVKGSAESDNSFVFIESYTAHYNRQHDWCYLNGQKFEEGWLIKLYDSQIGVAHSILHTALDTGNAQVARRSCETRMLVRY